MSTCTYGEVCFAVVAWTILWMIVNSCWFMVVFSLFIHFSLVTLFIIKSEVSQVSNYSCRTVYFSLQFCQFLLLFFFEFWFLGVNVFKIISSWGIDSLIIIIDPSLYLATFFCCYFKVHLSAIWVATPAFI